VVGAVLACAGPAGAIKDIPPTCTLKDGVMTVDNGYWRVTVEREADRIVSSYAKGDVSCGPVVPTVNNVDTMNISSDGTTLDFKGGPFAPGLTPEADGTSEIEINMPIGLLSGALDFNWGGADEHIAIGALSRTVVGINLNAGHGDSDADLQLTSPNRKDLRLLSVDFHLARGDDTVEAGGPGLKGPGNLGLAAIYGGPGDDNLAGGDGIDFLYAGPGGDNLEGNGGTDYIYTRDGNGDFVDCGKGEDALFRDVHDLYHSCEHSYRNRKDLKDDPPPLPFLRP
jgi:hypothetical protein